MKRFIQFFAQLFLVFFVCFGSNFSVFGQNQNKEEEEIIEVEGHSEDFYIDLSFEDLDVEVSDSQGNLLDVGELSSNEKEKIPFYCFLVMDQSAVFEGGNKSFYEIVNSQIHFSETMKEGRVFIGFAIDTTGKMTDLKVVESLSKENDKEALRIMHFINEHYTWKPAMENNKKIRVKTTTYILFKREEKLKSDTEQIYKR